jgi:hypothetical protein
MPLPEGSDTPKIRRQSITGGAFTSITSPIACSSVAIGNAGTDDLTVYSLDAEDGDTDRHLIIPPGFERQIRTSEGWREGAVVVKLKRTSTGDVVLIWG